MFASPPMTLWQLAACSLAEPSELDADLNGVFDAIHTISGQENVNEMETEIGSIPLKGYYQLTDSFPASP